jgi:hypothetical protein
VDRVLGFIETADLNKSGRVYLPNVINGLLNRFQFQKWPQKFEEMDEAKGIEFLEGLWDGTPVSKLTIYNSGFLVETQVSTAESERILEEALLWGAGQWGLSYQPGDIKRKRYVSDLTFNTDTPLLDAFAPFRELTSAVAEHASRIVEKPIPYFGSRLDAEIEHHPLNMPITPFSIQRRADTPMSENKYFSEAPLPTDIHVSLLEKFDRAVLDFLK